MLELPNVSQFVSSTSGETDRIAGEDHMAERHGRATMSQSTPAQEPFEQPAVRFDDARLHAHRAAGCRSEKSEHHPDRRHRQSPDVGGVKPDSIHVVFSQCSPVRRTDVQLTVDDWRFESPLMVRSVGLVVFPIAH